MKYYILPHTSPLICTYPNYTDLFFALGGFSDVRHWLLSRVIGLFGVWMSTYPEMIVNFCDNANPWYCPPMTACPLISTQFIYESTLLDMGANILIFLKKQIESGSYISICMDYSLIPEYKMFFPNPYRHQVLLYGYNDEEHFFYASGFVYMKSYERFHIPYDSFLKAFFSSRPLANASVPFFRYDNKNEIVTGDSYRSFFFNYMMSDTYIYNELSYYLNETRYPVFPDVYMGINVYKLYQRYCHHLSEQVEHATVLFHQPLQVVYQHKIALKHIYLTMCRNTFADSQILQTLDNLIQNTLLIRNKLLKYSVAHQLSHASSLIPKLESLQQIEQNVILSILDNGR